MSTRCRTGRCAGLCTPDGIRAVQREHGTALLRRARFLLGDADLAEDAVQEVLLRAWRGCSHLDPSGPPLQRWLMVVLRHVVIDMKRSPAGRPVPLGTPGSNLPDPHDAIAAAVLRVGLLDALASLGARHRTAVVTTVVHDRSPADVAAALDVPEGTVRSRTFYGLRRLREQLADRAS